MRAGPDLSADAPDAPSAPAGGGAQAVVRALSLLSLVGRGDGAGLGLAQLALAAGVTRPTARRLLLALGAARLVDQDPVTRRYHLGPEAYLLGTFAAERHGILQIALPGMRRLAQETGDTVLLTVPQDDHTLCLERIEGDYPVRTHALMRGDRKPAGVGAGAMAILAALPQAEAVALLDRVAGLIGDLRPMLEADLAETRALGHALNRGRIVAGSWGLGMVLLWPGGRPAGALSVAAIDSRMQPDRCRELIAALTRERAIIETQLAEIGQTSPRRSKDRRSSS